MLVSFLITLMLVGVGLYLVNTLIPMDARIKTVINVVVIVLVVFYVLQSFGLLSGVDVPRLRR
jgi:hypothetical protein